MQSDKRKKPEDTKVDATTDKDVTDEEVDEFFAIIRRIRDAVKYFENCNTGGGMEVKRWKPSFEKEDFLAEAGKKEEDEEGAEKNKGLDLNVGLEAEDSSV